MKTNPTTKNPTPNKTSYPKDLVIGVIGATGIVGQEFVKILDQRHFPLAKLRLFASEKSVGEEIQFRGEKIKVEGLKPGCFKGIHCAFFSAGGDISKEWGPKAVQEGAFVIDNSSAFRMDKNISLVVPEVNGHKIPKSSAAPELIANPNCSTIQLVVALKPLHDAYTLKSVTVATYQSVSGAGREGGDELKAQTKAFLQNESEPQPSVFAHPIAFNNLPHIDKFDPATGFTLEELKVINETRKILDLPNLDVSCTAVRTPTLNSHSEAVWVELEKSPSSKNELIKAMENFAGLTIEDNPDKKLYPLARKASGLDDVYVGRIRKDLHNPKRWLLWVVSDNVRKGAALNGIQIAEKLFNIES